MKGKAKLDGDAMKRFFVTHGEKIGFGAVCLFVVLLLVFAIGKKPVPDDQQPQNLDGLAKSAEAAIRDRDPRGVPRPNIPEKMAQVAPDTYQVRPWIWNIVKLKRKRPEPVYLGVEDLQVVAGRGLFAFRGKGAAAAAAAASAAAPTSDGSELAGYQMSETDDGRGQHFAIVAGKVPWVRQEAEYFKAFENTVRDPKDERPGQDFPEYYRFIMYRAEVVPGLPDDKLTWVPLTEEDNAKTTNEVRDAALAALRGQYAGVLPEVVDQHYVEPSLVYVNVPEVKADSSEQAVGWLPPLVLRNWQKGEVCHRDVLQAIENPMQPAPSANPMPTTPTTTNPMPTTPMPTTPMTGEAKLPTKVADQPAEEDEEAKAKRKARAYGYRLLRYFDWTVKPGKQYRYRVTLVLRNPSRGFKDQYLRNKDLAMGEFRMSPPSAPSPVLSVPRNVEVFAGAVVSATQTRTHEVTAKVMIAVWQDVAEAIKTAEDEAKKLIRLKDRNDALKQANTFVTTWAGIDHVEAAREFDVVRGGWMNLLDVVTAMHAKERKGIDLKMVRFFSDSLLVDLRGGTPLVKPRPRTPRGTPVTFTEPGEMLILDPDGNLVIRSELDDHARYAEKLPAKTADKAAGDAAKEQ